MQNETRTSITCTPQMNDSKNTASMDSTAQTGNVGGIDWQEEAYQKSTSSVNRRGPTRDTNFCEDFVEEHNPHKGLHFQWDMTSPNLLMFGSRNHCNRMVPALPFITTAN
ncbi:hypothetical protein QJS04_geneDACA020290 [Acorus gramineus]|uniref:Uncharacterized protein n=1 Tax=Acorus gramineus TaxID=55184 RepID=A0AAV9ABE6_ACOGR|nr:hypothetical protein QJS04_geneDACA020290 [Acorus gramineus]